jgi:hypothetical protein
VDAKYIIWENHCMKVKKMVAMLYISHGSAHLPSTKCCISIKCLQCTIHMPRQLIPELKGGGGNHTQSQ